jgi:hypothetical protein
MKVAFYVIRFRMKRRRIIKGIHTPCFQWPTSESSKSEISLKYKTFAVKIAISILFVDLRIL